MRNASVWRIEAKRSPEKARFNDLRAEIDANHRYKRISYDQNKGERCFVDHFLKRYYNGKQPREIVLDLDATDDHYTAIKKVGSGL